MWVVAVGLAIVFLGISTSEFFKFGPSSSVTFFKITIDTWTKWSYVCAYTVINQLVQTYGLETITPWMLNDVQNRDKIEQRFSHGITQGIIQLWYVYLWIDEVIGIQILLMQFDFLLVVLLSDLTATFITMELYIREKNASSGYRDISNSRVETITDFHRMYGSV